MNSLTPEEEIEEISDCLKLFSSGDNQGHNPQCDSKTLEHLNRCRPEVCPDFLMDNMIERDPQSKIFDWDSSPDEVCGLPSEEGEDPHFQSSQDLENYLKNTEPFSSIDTPLIAECLQYKVPIAINKTSAPRLKNLLKINKNFYC